MAHTLRQPEQLRVLANGVRQELVDTLGALGGQATVRELATQLCRPSKCPPMVRANATTA